MGPGDKKKAEKRKKKTGNEDEEKLPTEKKAKKRKIEKAVNWGETELEEELNVRSWLLKDTNNEDIATMGKEADRMTSTSDKAGVDTKAVKRMKQLELNWKKHMNKEDYDEDPSEEPAKAEKVDTPKVKLKVKVKDTKKLALKKAAESSKSILDWIKPNPKSRQDEDMDWSDDKNIPGGESIITIERKEEAKRKKESWRIRRMCQDEVESLLSHVEGTSVAGALVAGLVDRSWTEVCRKRIWDMLEADEDLKNWTKRRLELKAEDDARTKAETIREERMLRKAMLEFEWNLRRKMVVEDMEVRG